MSIRRLTIALLAGLMVIAVPQTAFADPAGPTDYRSDVSLISPPTPEIKVDVLGSDAFLRVEVEPGNELIVLGYEYEPYLRITETGVVEQNRLSPATYYNKSRYAVEAAPEFADPTAPPIWDKIGDGGVWAWHDHRAHWMLPEPLIGLEPGQSLDPQTLTVLVNGERTAISVVITLLEPAPRWPAIVGILGGLLLALVAWQSPRGSAVTLAVFATIVGAGQFLSLPAETGPSVTWWSMPVIALLAALTTLAVKSALLRGALIALSGLQVLVWAFQRRGGLSHAWIPTDIPQQFDRVVTAAALPAAAALIVFGIWQMLRPPASLQTTSPTATA